MKEIIEKEKDYMDFSEPVKNALSPYDTAFPVELLFNGLKSKLVQAKKFAEKVYTAVAKASPMIVQVSEAIKKDFRLVVDVDNKTLEAIKYGNIKLTTELGKMYAQIRKANGQYGSKLPIKLEEFSKGLDPIQMVNTLQMMALQEMLQKITDQIAIIDLSIREVIQGQQNDRIGLYYSGLTLYLEAQDINNPEMKKALEVQSLRALSDATFQLMLTMQSDINYLSEGKYKIHKGKSVELIDSRMNSIEQSFSVIHQATMLRASIYCNDGELNAMSTVLEEYSRFIDGTVAKNADLLAQCDIRDSGTEEGLWKSRAKLKLDVSEFAKHLNNHDKTIYIGFAKEND